MGVGRPDVRQSDLAGVDRRRRTVSPLLGNPYEAFASVAAVLVSLAFFLAPAAVKSSTISRELGDVSYVWAVLYGLGGLITICGLWGGKLSRIPLEIAGLSLFTSAVFINATVVIFSTGWRGVTAITIYVAVAWGNLVRAYVLVKIASRLTP